MNEPEGVPAQTQPAVLEAIRVFGNTQRPGEATAQVRVVLSFDREAIFRRSEHAAGAGQTRQVFLELDGATPSAALAQLVNVNAGGVQRIRTQALPDGQLRVSFDVESDAGYRMFHLTQPYRLIMDFRRAQATARAGAAWTVVLDPGHGGAQDGASGPNGLEESVVALSLAKRVQKALLRQLPGSRVLLTRDRDATVSLEERSALANALDADLFVSIHLNASPSPTDRGGVSTYVLDTSSDAQAMRLAARENDADVAEVTGLQKLYASLYRKDQVAHSLQLAHAVQARTLARGRALLPGLEDRGVKKAMFYVLVGTTMPAVLCEASFITRPDEAAALATDGYRDALADGIADGIAEYSRAALRARQTARR